MNTSNNRTQIGNLSKNQSFVTCLTKKSGRILELAVEDSEVGVLVKFEGELEPRGLSPKVLVAPIYIN